MKRPELSQADASKLALAQKAFDQFYAQCFWFMLPNLKVTEADLPAIIEGLRKRGGREAFLLAERLCR